MKKPQMQVAEVLYEMGVSFDLIEKMTQISPEQYLQEVVEQNELSGK